MTAKDNLPADDDATIVMPWSPATVVAPDAGPTLLARVPGGSEDKTIVLGLVSAVAARVPAKPLAPSSILCRRYRILKTIGRGGFSFVYLAEHIRTGQLVAIKEAFPSEGAVRLPDSSVGLDESPMAAVARRALLLEVTAIARAQHPNVVRLEDAFEANGTLYFGMEFIEGEPMAALLDRQRGLSLETATPVAQQLLDALEHMHGHDLVHGDIKPSNIILRTNKSPVLIDFGSAVRISDTVGDRGAYTPGFSAPERTRPGGGVGPWSDVFSVCATMLAVLTGLRPDDKQQSLGWTTASFPRAAGSPEERRMRHGLLAGIAQAPADRPQSINELRSMLALSGTAIASHQSGAPRHSIFISYARADTPRVEPVVRALQLNGINVWIDRTGIAPGEVWGREIVKGLRESFLVLVFCSKNSMASQNVAREIYLADREKRSIVAALLDDTPFTDDVALFMTPAQHIDLRGGDTAGAVEAVRALLIGKQRAAAS